MPYTRGMTENKTPEQLVDEHGVGHFNEADGYTPVKGCQRCEDAVDSSFEMASDMG